MTAISHQHLSPSLYPSTDPRPAAPCRHWGQLFRGGLMWLRPEEGWDEIREEKRWLSVLRGPTQYCNHLTPILRFILPSQMPQTSSQNLKIIFYLSGFSHFHFPLVLLCPVSPSVSSPVSLTLLPSCCLLYLLLIDPLAVTLGFSLALSASQRGIYEDKCDPTDTRYLFSSQSQSATM